MVTKVNQDELLELLNIPEFERLIYNKIEETKEILKDKIDSYKNIKEYLKKTTSRNPSYINDDPSRRVQIYRFEFNRIETMEWIPVMVDPLPPNGCSIEDIIPTSLVRHIASYPVNPHRVQNFKIETKETGIHRCQEVEFIRYSEDYLFGGIRLIDISEQNDSGNHAESLIVEIEWDYDKKGDEKNFQDLFYYMQRFPEIKNCILGDFFHRLKPRLDSRLRRSISD